MRDGASLLVETYDEDGKLISTESQNPAMIPDLRTFTESRLGLREEIQEIYDSPGLPRVSRILLYLGYVLLSIAVLNWSVAFHDISQVDFFTGQAALGGFRRARPGQARDRGLGALDADRGLAIRASICTLSLEHPMCSNRP